MTTPFEQLKNSAESVNDLTIIQTHAEFTQSIIRNIHEFCEANNFSSVGEIMGVAQSIYFSTIINLIRNCGLTRLEAERFLAQTQKDQSGFTRQALDQFEDFTRG